MPNVDQPSGFRPVRHLNGNPWNGATNTYAVLATDAAAIGIGDPVELAGSCTAAGIPYVKKAASGDILTGVMTAIDFQPDDLTTQYRTASVAMLVKVVDDPQVIFEIQEDSDGNSMPVTDCSGNADFIDGGVNTDTGVSGVEIDSTSAATTNTLDMQILRLVQRTDNAIGDNAKWEVRLNNYRYTNQLAGVQG